MAGGGSFDIDYSELDRWLAEIRKAPKIVVDELVDAVNRILSEVVRLAVRNIEQNQSIVTGNLRRSIASTGARVSGGAVTGSAGTNVTYAKPVEFGRRAIDAGPGRVLAFKPRMAGPVRLGSPTLRPTTTANPFSNSGNRNAGWVFRRRVGPAAPRPFLRPAFQQVKPGAQKELRAAITRIIDQLSKAA